MLRGPDTHHWCRGLAKAHLRACELFADACSLGSGDDDFDTGFEDFFVVCLMFRQDRCADFAGVERVLVNSGLGERSAPQILGNGLIASCLPAGQRVG